MKNQSNRITSRRAFLTGVTGGIVCLAAFGAGSALGHLTSDGGDTFSLAECEAEDSEPPTGCWWNARTRGNGLGTSFVVLGDGTFIYLTE